MTPREIEALATEILAAHEITDLPVDPFEIAKFEGIALLSGDYDDCFDGRIEYRKKGDKGRFYIFYAAASSSRSQARVRFSVAHELGHYFIPRHQDFLLSGVWHGSRAGFVSTKPMERHADQFAASLLMPRQQFDAQVKTKRGQCSLADLSGFAENIFDTSVISTAIRYVQMDYEPSCVVASQVGNVLFSYPSDSFRDMKLGWIERGSPVPNMTSTASLLEKRKDRSEGRVASDIWFDRGEPVQLWEDAMAFGGSGYAITLLVAEEVED